MCYAVQELMQPDDKRLQQKELREAAQVAERLDCSVIYLSIALCFKL